MEYLELIETLAIEGYTNILFLIIDGLGGVGIDEKGGSELEIARIPNLDMLARDSSCGLSEPVAPGVTPGSGPSHLSLFGYDPFRNNIGRGILSALGVGFKLTERDVAARVNFATIDEDSILLDRRAGRIATEENRRLCKKILDSITLSSDVELFLEPEKEHRAVLVLRGDYLYGDIQDTDPQRVGVKPLEPLPLTKDSERTAEIVKDFLTQVGEILKDEHPANAMLLRGFAKYKPLPTLKERFKLSSLAIANYPMYQGVARLVGMDVHPTQKDIAGQFNALKERIKDYDFIYLHIKETDSSGEDGDFERKVRVLEEVDRFIPSVMALKPDVIVVTGDHSTPSLLKAHSWHPVPFLIRSRYARKDRVDRFDEISCASGILGRFPAINAMPLALAHAKRLTKFGA